MKMLYVANIRIPTEKAHGVAIVKSCEAFSIAGVETTLVVPRRRTPFQKSVFETYNVAQKFSIRFLPVIDLIREKAGKGVFVLESISFYLALCIYLIFTSRQTLIYTREADVLLCSRFGFKVIFECHVIPGNREKFFARARSAHRIIVISQALKNAFIAAGFSDEAVLVAPSGVDLTIFDFEMNTADARERIDVPRDGKIIVYTGNFTTMGEDKGISDIIRALKDVSGVTFVAVGGSEKDQERYRIEAQTQQVLDRVILRGATTQKMLALYQKAADILLMPFPDTPHYRNHMSPVKMFEYMAAQRPIIASDLPTIREVLSESNARIVPPGDSAEIARAIRDLMLRPAEGETLAQNAYTEVRKYSWHSRTERILAWLTTAPVV